MRRALDQKWGVRVQGRWRWWTVGELLAIARKAVETGLVK